MKRLAIIAISLLLVTACDDAEEAPTETETETETASATATEPAEPDHLDPQVYMALANATLQKLQTDITRCSLPWRERYPNEELKVHLVFELDPSGAVERVKAGVPEEGGDIGQCMERVVAAAKFPRQAPPKPFEKTLVFNPQDPEIKAFRERQKKEEAP